MLQDQELDTVPWYRQPWVWFVIALPLASVIGSLTLVTIAVKNQDDLVRDDWYKAGRGINQDLHAENHARELDLTATLVLEPAVPAVRVTMPGTAALPTRLSLSLVHSTIAAEDMTVILERVGEREWYAALPGLPMGKRHLMLEPGDAIPEAARWRLRAGDVIFQGVPVDLLPSG